MAAFVARKILAVVAVVALAVLAGPLSAAQQPPAAPVLLGVEPGEGACGATVALRFRGGPFPPWSEALVGGVPAKVSGATPDGLDASLEIPFEAAAGARDVTVVVPRERDEGAPLAAFSRAQVLAFADANEDARPGPGDAFYVTTNFTVLPGSLRLTPSGGRAAGTIVAAGDADQGSPARALQAPVGSVDADGDLAWSWRDRLVVDLDASGDASAADLLLGGEGAGGFVGSGADAPRGRIAALDLVLRMVDADADGPPSAPDVVVWDDPAQSKAGAGRLSEGDVLLAADRFGRIVAPPSTTTLPDAFRVACAEGWRLRVESVRFLLPEGWEGETGDVAARLVVEVANAGDEASPPFTVRVAGASADEAWFAASDEGVPAGGTREVEVAVALAGGGAGGVDHRFRVSVVPDGGDASAAEVVTLSVGVPAPAGPSPLEMALAGGGAVAVAGGGAALGRVGWRRLRRKRLEREATTRREPGGCSGRRVRVRKESLEARPKWRAVTRLDVRLQTEGAGGASTRREAPREAVEALHEAIRRHRLGADGARLHALLAPVADALARDLEEAVRGTGVPAWVEVGAHLEGGETECRFVLERCERAAGGRAWREASSWVARSKDERDEPVLAFGVDEQVPGLAVHVQAPLLEGLVALVRRAWPPTLGSRSVRVERADPEEPGARERAPA